MGDRKGWRLPTAEELATLVEPSELNLALPVGHPFFDVQPAAYWTSTTGAGFLTDSAWTVSFYNGNVGLSGKASTGVRVWCMRGGQGHDGVAQQ